MPIGLDRLIRRAQRLCDDLSTVEPTPRIGGPHSYVDVGSVGFEVHQRGKVGDVVWHRGEL